MFQNRLFVLFSSILLLASSALGGPKESNFYLKTLVTLSKIDSVKEVDKDMNFSVSHESGLSPAIGIGIGYYINKYARVDITGERQNAYFLNESNSFDYTEDGMHTFGTRSVKRKAYINSLMLNGYVDIINKRYYRIFIGAGSGIAQIKEKVSYSMSGTSMQYTQIFTFPLLTEKHSNKAFINFAYSLTVGTSMRVMPNANIEFTYSWKDFGKLKPIKNSNDKPVGNRYKGQHFSVGIRFDL